MRRPDGGAGEEEDGGIFWRLWRSDSEEMEELIVRTERQEGENEGENDEGRRWERIAPQEPRRR
jgi:hypothetical protein